MPSYLRPHRLHAQTDLSTNTPLPLGPDRLPRGAFSRDSSPTGLRLSLPVIFPLIVLCMIGCDLVPPAPNTSSSGNSGANAVVETFYVSPLGDDAADGASRAAAFKTITRAVRAIGPGDTLVVLPGNYAEAIVLENVGMKDAPTIIRGDGPGVVLDGERSRGVGFWCTHCTDMTLEDIEFQNYTDIGVLVMLSNNVTLRRLTLHENGLAAKLSWVEGYGMHAEDSSNVTVEENDVFRNGPDPQVLDRWLGTGIDMFKITDSVIRNNRSHDNTGGGLLVEDSINVLVDGNEITGNNLDATIEDWWDGAIWVDGGRDITLRNNIIRNNIGPGVQLSDEDFQNPSGYVLEGNTISDNFYGLYIWNFGTSTLPPPAIIDVKPDNQIINNTTMDFWILAQN